MHGLKPLNNDHDALQFAKHVIYIKVIDVYVEHNVDNPNIVDASDLGTNLDDDGDVQCNIFRSENILLIMVMMNMLKK